MASILLESTNDVVALRQTHVAGVQQRAQADQVLCNCTRAEGCIRELCENKRSVALGHQSSKSRGHVSEFGGVAAHRVYIAELLQPHDQFQDVLDLYVGATAP